MLTNILSCPDYCCLVSSFGLLVSFQLVIGILKHFSIVLVSYKSLALVLVLVSYKTMVAIQHTATMHGSYSAFNIQYSVEHTSSWLEVCSTIILDYSTSALVSFSLVFGAI